MKTSHIGYFEHRLVMLYTSLQYNCKTGTTNTGLVLSKNIFLFTHRKRFYDKDNFFLFCYKFNIEIINVWLFMSMRGKGYNEI
jgi:hypothetical protein